MYYGNLSSLFMWKHNSKEVNDSLWPVKFLASFWKEQHAVKY